MKSFDIPEALKQRQQWLVWKFINKPGQKKPAKMPYYATTGNLRGWPHGKPRDGEPSEEQPQVEQGHDLDRQHLVDFETAMETSALRGFDGVGFAFLPGDGLIGIDLDAACADKHASIRDACGTFAERSPSGTGVHIIGLGECETFKSNDVGIEVFCGRQFFTVTGQHDGDSPLELREIPAETISKLRRTVERAKEAAREAKEAARPQPAPSQQPPTVVSNAEASRYCLAALESAVQRLRSATEGGRNDLLNAEAYGLAQLIHTGGISEATIRAALQDAAQSCGLPPGEAKATISSGLRAGQQSPRKLPQLETAQRYHQHNSGPAIDPETGEIIDAPANDNDQPEPLDIFAECPAPALRRGMLPQSIEDYAFECGDLLGVSPGMVAIPALVACAAALHDNVQIKVKRHEDWRESARLWCAVVGEPSVKKSPSMSRATKRLRKIDIDLSDENSRRQADYADQMEQFKDAKKEAKKMGGGFVKAPEAPRIERMVVEDATIEALSEVLKDNPRGVLCVQDELSGWFGMMDAYTGNKGGGKDRAAWLQAYNGGGRVVDRVMRGSFKIPNWSVSMIGGIQPDAIRRIAQNMTDDGLMQRFMIIIGENAVEHDRPENREAYATFSALVDHLYAVQGGNEPVTMTEGAHRIREALNAYTAELSQYPALPGGLRSHLGKWSGLFARLLLVFHAIECASESIHPASRQVTEATAGRVDRLMRKFLLPHAMSYYTDVLGGSGDLEHGRWIAGHILSKGLAVITNRDITQAYKQWRGLDDWRRQRIMQMLEDMGWVTPYTEEGAKPSRRGATQWAIPSRVHQMFAEKARTEATRRERLRAEIAAMQAR